MSLRFLSKNIQFLTLSVLKRSKILKTNQRYLRGRGGAQPQAGRRILSSSEFRDQLDVEEDDGDIDLTEYTVNEKVNQIEDFIANVDLKNPSTRSELESLAALDRQRLKKLIIKKKTTKRKPELNVLTWQAKEQIRYLTQENPEVWTLEKVVESFPVSRDGVLNILRSTYIPHDENEIRKHDNKAVKNIDLIRQRLREDGDTLDEEERNFLQEKLTKLGNAAGIQSLPLKKIVTRRTIAAQSKLLRPAKKIGPFQSMMMYCDTITKGLEYVEKEKYVLIPDVENSKTVQNFVPESKEDGNLNKKIYLSENSDQDRKDHSNNMSFNDLPRKPYSERQKRLDSDLSSSMPKEKFVPDTKAAGKIQEYDVMSAFREKVKQQERNERREENVNNLTDDDQYSNNNENHFSEKKKNILTMQEENKQFANKSRTHKYDVMSAFKEKVAQQKLDEKKEGNTIKFKDFNENLYDDQQFSNNSNIAFTQKKKDIQTMQEENTKYAYNVKKNRFKKWNTEQDSFGDRMFGKTGTKQIPNPKFSHDDDDYRNQQKSRRVMSSSNNKQTGVKGYQRVGDTVYDEHGEFIYKIP